MGMLEALPINEFVFFVNKGLLAGLIIGSIYALGAVGVTLIFGILRFAHFPHGDMMTLGAFVALVLTLIAPGVGDLVGLPTAFVLMPIATIWRWPPDNSPAGCLRFSFNGGKKP